MAGPVKLAALVLAACAFAVIAARADPPPLKIGVLTDASGPYVDFGRPGLRGRRRNGGKGFRRGGFGPGVSRSSSATRSTSPTSPSASRGAGSDVEGVSAVTDLPVTPVAFSVQALAKEKNRTVLITAGATTDITARLSPIGSSHWADDTHAMATSIAKAVTASGRENLVLPHRRHRLRRRAAEGHDRRGREGRRQGAGERQISDQRAGLLFATVAGAGLGRG